jgi:hypothetical protein
MRLLVSGSLDGMKSLRIPYRLAPDLTTHKYGGAVIWLLDVESGHFSDYFVPNAEQVSSFEHHAPPGPMNLDRFTGLCEFEGRYFVTTFNEVLVIEKQTRRLIEVYSQPSFNDLHCCLAYEKGQVIANTGMDCIEIFDRDWKQVDRVRFEDARDIDGRDWRQVPTTKPHVCHVNWVFMLRGELWCTRYVNRDAVKVYDPTVRMKIDHGLPHDGFVQNGNVFFTTANGRIASHKATGFHEQHLLLQLEDILCSKQFGWVRGLYYDEEHFFIGNTRLRQTTSREVLNWIQSKPPNYSNSAVLQIRAKDKRLVSIMELPQPHGVVFSLLPM